MPGKYGRAGILSATKCLTDRPEYLVVYVKCAKGYYAGQEYLPGGLAKLPALVYPHTERIENEQQKQRTVYGAKGFYQRWVRRGILKWYGHKNQQE